MVGNRWYINENICKDLTVYVAKPTVEIGKCAKEMIAKVKEIANPYYKFFWVSSGKF